MNHKSRLGQLERAVNPPRKSSIEIVSLNTIYDDAGNITEEYATGPYSIEDLKAERVPDSTLIIHNVITVGVSIEL